MLDNFSALFYAYWEEEELDQIKILINEQILKLKII